MICRVSFTYMMAARPAISDGHTSLQYVRSSSLNVYVCKPLYLKKGTLISTDTKTEKKYMQSLF